MTEEAEERIFAELLANQTAMCELLGVDRDADEIREMARDVYSGNDAEPRLARQKRRIDAVREEEQGDKAKRVVYATCRSTTPLRKTRRALPADAVAQDFITGDPVRIDAHLRADADAFALAALGQWVATSKTALRAMAQDANAVVYPCESAGSLAHVDHGAPYLNLRRVGLHTGGLLALGQLKRAIETPRIRYLKLVAPSTRRVNKTHVRATASLAVLRGGTRLGALHGQEGTNTFIFTARAGSLSSSSI